MNKRGLIKYILIFITSVISFYFITKTSDSGINSMFNVAVIFEFLLALTIFMYINKNKIKKFKFIYDVLLILLMIFSVLWVGFFLYSLISCFLSNSCSVDPNVNFTVVYIAILFILLMLNFRDIFNKTNKVNDVIAIAVSILIILIHLRVYLEPGYINELLSPDSYDPYTYNFIAQNYVYFVIMYLITLIHYRVNKEF